MIGGFLPIAIAAFAQPSLPAPAPSQRECVGQVLRDYPRSFAEGVSSVYKFQLDRTHAADLRAFMHGIEAMGAALVPVQINNVDYIFVVPSNPSRSIQDLSEQVHAICDLLPSLSVRLIEYQHAVTGHSEEPR